MLNKEIKVKSFDLPSVPNEALSLHFRALFLGASGSGKTTFCINLINRYYKNKQVFNNIILISPTGTINEETGMRGEIKWQGMADEEYSNCTQATLKYSLDRQTKRIVEHKEYLADKKLYDKFIHEGIDSLTHFELLRLYDKYDMEKPTSPHGTEHYPTALIIFDDCCSATAEGKWLGNFLSKSRHYNCSVMILCQHYAQCSKAVRTNLSALFLFKTLDEKLLKTLHEQQISNTMSYDKLKELMKKLEHRYDFMTMDWNQKDPKMIYRKNFDERLEY